MEKQTTCGIVIRDADGKYLLCHATGQQHYSIPKGIAENDEDFKVAAIRETKELFLEWLNPRMSNLLRELI